jgi:hypothetical protein
MEPNVFELRILVRTEDGIEAESIFEEIERTLRSLKEMDEFQAILLEGFTQDTVEIMAQAEAGEDG